MSNLVTDRLHGLDAVRASALLLGIVFHSAFSFFPGDQFWLIMDTQRSAILSGTAFALHIFRMTLFFLLAGYFGRMQTYRLGSGKFILDRIKRIAVPLIVFWPIVMICFIALAIWAMVVANGGTMPENPPPAPPMTVKTFPLTHLWFLYGLILLYITMLVGRGLLWAMGLKRLIERVCDAALRLLAPIGTLPFLLAIPIAIAFLFQPQWHPFFGIPTPEYGFIPNRIAVIAYGGAFALGWIMQREKDTLQKATQLWPLYLVGAVLLSIYCLAAAGTEVKYIQPLPKYSTLAYPVAYALAIWFWTFGLIGMGLSVWSKENRVRRYLADASYWLYLIHLPIIIALQIWVSQWTWQAELKFAMILGLSIPLMLLSYEFLVRYSFIGWLLNGRKYQHSKRNIEKAIA